MCSSAIRSHCGSINIYSPINSVNRFIFINSLIHFGSFEYANKQTKKKTKENKQTIPVVVT